MHVYQLGSYLVFQSQLASAPSGALSAWEHKGSPRARALNAMLTVFALQSVAVWSFSNQELWFHTAGMLHCELYLYPFQDGVPTDNSCHLTQAADEKKKKTGSTPKSSCNSCM